MTSSEVRKLKPGDAALSPNKSEESLAPRLRVHVRDDINENELLGMETQRKDKVPNLPNTRVDPTRTRVDKRRAGFPSPFCGLVLRRQHQIKKTWGRDVSRTTSLSYNRPGEDRERREETNRLI